MSFFFLLNHFFFTLFDLFCVKYVIINSRVWHFFGVFLGVFCSKNPQMCSKNPQNYLLVSKIFIIIVNITCITITIFWRFFGEFFVLKIPKCVLKVPQKVVGVKNNYYNCSYYSYIDNNIWTIFSAFFRGVFLF